jgi:glycosyltransferase involved in cell wall biosynthesis
MRPYRHRVQDPADPARRRIALVGPGFHFTGGLSVYTCRLANALAVDHDPSVLLLQRLIPDRLYPGRGRIGVPLSNLRYDDDVRMLGSVDWFWGRPFARALASLRDARPDVLVLQWWTAATLHTYLVLALAARRLGIPVVIEFHESQDPEEASMRGPAAYARRLVPRLLALCSGAVIHTTHDLDLLRQAFGAAAIDRLAVEITPHGPYDHLNHAGGEVIPTATADTTNLLFFGLIRRYKGLEDLVRAFNDLSPDQATQFRQTVVGETWQGWDEPAELIAASPHRDRITFVNRYVSDDEAAAYLAGADAMVLPYRRGSASGPLHMAMSAGIHVLLYAVGGLVEAAEKYEGAQLIAPDDVAALRRAILSLPPVRGRRFDDPHSWDASVAAYGRLAAALSRT